MALKDHHQIRNKILKINLMFVEEKFQKLLLLDDNTIEDG
jgi:hypothetical protein